MIHCTRRRLKFCFCISWFSLLLFTTSLAILSIVYGIKDLRQVSLDKYSSHISKWEKSKRPEFSDLEIKVNDSLNNEVHLVKQEQDPMMIRKDNYTKIKEYNPMFYSINIHNSREFNKTENVNFSISIFEKDSISNLTLSSVKAYKTSTLSILRGACKSIGGTYTGFASCKLLWRLNGFCVKIKKDQSWQLDKNWNYYSCSLDDTIGTYQIIKDRDELGDMTYEVRSGDDPLILAKHLTSKTMNFGLTRFSWEVMGFVWLALSLFLISQPTIYFKKRIYGELKESPILIEFQPRKTETMNVGK